MDDSENTKEFSALFDSYSEFGSGKVEGKISLRNIQKWFQQAEMAKMETAIKDECIAEEYKKLFKDNTHITLSELESLIDSIASSKKMDEKIIMDKLIAAGEPKISSFKDIVSQVC